MSKTSTAPLESAVHAALERFVEWQRRFGGHSYDHQTFYSGSIGGRAKKLYYRQRSLGTAAVAPIVFCEAFAPSLRRWFGPMTRFPIADAHYAMGFALLSTRQGDESHGSAVRFLAALEASRSPGYEHCCWGYPFDWVTSSGILKAWTPFITSTPYAYEAFRAVFEIDGDERWLRVCRSIAEHALRDIREFPTSPGAASCGYGPYDERGGVVNAAAYRASLLTQAAADFGEERYWDAGRRNLAFVVEAQQPDGSWFYAIDGARTFVDHFHTCFVLKALAKIDDRMPAAGCKQAIASGLAYYQSSLFDEQGLPKPFSRAPRLTVYRRELYDYAECVNVCLLLRDEFPSLERTLEVVLRDVLERWIKPDGSFRSRELMIGWDNVPMHRWAQSQMFRSLALYLAQARAVRAPRNAAEVGVFA